MKRLRKKYGAGIRYLHCGEYGDKDRRPHYHACIFGWEPADKVLWKIINGNPLYISKILQKVWGLGFCSVGALTYQSAAYVARYNLKKVTGKNAENHYTWADRYTGEIHEHVPEYATMSRRPGLGSGWYLKFRNDVYPGDFVITKGKKAMPPKYYDKMEDKYNAEEMERTRAARVNNAEARAHDNTEARLKVREKVKLEQLKQLKRE
ncbi:MAG: replication initiator protein [Microviridae sp.]|nr:MAG: replication initiator protein [Microviridae sp.]